MTRTVLPIVDPTPDGIRPGVTRGAFDLEAYEDEFNDSIVPAYRRGVADAEWPADIGLARSVIPPGTASVRDFSHLAPQLPRFVAEQCVGCMACVSTCPDSALLATVVPEAALDAAVTGFATAAGAAHDAPIDLRGRFARTKKYADVPERQGIEPGAFGLFVDPAHCKGCGECVEVCASLGHDALFMTDKLEATEDEPSTLEEAAVAMRFLRSLPPTPSAYRNDKALADLMLGPDAFGYAGGAGSCAGCGEGTAIRMMVAATRQVYGPESMGIVAATGCNSVFGSTYPFNPYLVPWTNSLFENAPAVASGIRLGWDQAGHPERRLWVMGGDGAMYDIGFQALSRMVASRADIKVLVLDTQVYSNTGGQASTASFGGQVTKLSAFGAALHGRPEPRKELGRILMAHGDVYVAQTTPAHLNHFYRSVMDANEYPGPAVVIVYSACMPEHGIADDAASHQARLAVDSRAFPLFTYDPRRGDRISDRLSLQGNPAMREDWSRTPAGDPVDFVTFARTEGRFAPHFAADGQPSPEILATRQDRLDAWRTLQELAGIPTQPGPNGPAGPVASGRTAGGSRPVEPVQRT
jgi:pyruvate/2-oxoacid:ferredoxin oxidoreductase beta subunit/formate hydrogenlyase subunit 6/NADH:ubiquinone oxidoreductase subunit I